MGHCAVISGVCDGHGGRDTSPVWAERWCSEDVPDLVELRWRSRLMLGGCSDSFGLVRGVRVGVSVQGGDELRHLLVAADAAERALGVE